MDVIRNRIRRKQIEFQLATIALRLIEYRPRCSVGVEPIRVAFSRYNEWHSIVNGPYQIIGFGGNDGEGIDNFTRVGAPCRP